MADGTYTSNYKEHLNEERIYAKRALSGATTQADTPPRAHIDCHLYPMVPQSLK